MAATGHCRRRIGRDWSHDFFEFLGPHYHELYDGLTADRSRREVTAVLALTGVRTPGPVIDLGCGTGRHAVELARRGYQVTAVDQSAAMLNLARARAKRARTTVDWRQADLRDFAAPGRFALALSLFNTVGYGSDGDNARMLARAAALLKPDGAMVIEMFNRDHYLREFKERTWEKKRSFIEMTQVEFDCVTSRFEIDAGYFFADHREAHHFSIRVYSCPEMDALARGAGLEITAVYGGLDRCPLTLEADRMVLVLRRR